MLARSMHFGIITNSCRGQADCAARLAARSAILAGVLEEIFEDGDNEVAFEQFLRFLDQINQPVYAESEI
jgi:hypothetical protein